MNVKSYKRIKLIKENLISTWCFCMRPLAYILIKYDNWYYKHRIKVHLKWSDEYVIKKYTKIFIKQLIDSREKENYFEITDHTNYYESNKTILEAIRSEQKFHLYDWYFDTNQRNTINRIKQLTNLFIKELDKYPEISYRYFDYRDKNKYCDVPFGYEKTLEVKIKEDL